jgi:spore maturation protein CgeB
MTAAASGPRVLLIASFDDGFHAHSALKRRALERLGCHVSAFDLLERPGLLARLRGTSLHERLRRALDARPELVLVLDDGALSPAMIAPLKREAAAPWLSWFPGDIRSIAAMRDAAPAYDRCFVAGSDLVARIGGPGMPPACYLAHGCDPSVHRPMRARDQFRANVVFAGTATPRRATLLAELVEFGLAIWGTGWRRTPLRDYCRGELLPERDYVRAYAGASVAVNLHHVAEDEPDDTGVNQRTFELAAIGVPQVVDWRRDLERCFEVGRDLHAFRTGTELKAIVKELLHDPPAAEAVGAAGRRRALTEHTYMHRVRELLRLAGTGR